MVEATVNPEEGTEEVRLNELANNQDRTPEETTEFEKLRKAKDDRNAKSRIEELNNKTKDAEREAERARLKAEDLERRLKEMESKPSEPVINTDTIEAGGKKFHTDAALRSMIDSGKMTETEAYGHQQSRIEEVAADKALKRLKGEQQEESKKNQAAQDIKEVFQKYPQWDSNNRDFNPNDPLYKTANECYQDGMSIKKAMQYAEKLHGKVGTKPDLSSHLGVHSPSAPGDTPVKEKPLSSDEQDIAYRLYRNKVNPNTGRVYTETEAYAKYQKAKTSRGSGRV